MHTPKHVPHDFREYALLFSEILKQVREQASRIIDGDLVVTQGAQFGDLYSDTEIKADVLLGEFICERLRDAEPSAIITIEGQRDSGPMEGMQPSLWFCVDPLDGSLNYKMRGRTMGLPFSSCITALSRKDGATFTDIVASAVMDLRCGDQWVAWKRRDGQYRTFLNSFTERAQTDDRQDLDIGSMIVLGEMYYPENRERLARLFAGKKGWLRNPGSAAYEMALVSSGQVVAFISDQQKQHELGAAYAIVKGAGGVVVDFEGRDLGTRKYDFTSQIPVVVAANPAIAEQIIRGMQSS